MCRQVLRNNLLPARVNSHLAHTRRLGELQNKWVQYSMTQLSIVHYLLVSKIFKICKEKIFQPVFLIEAIKPNFIYLSCSVVLLERKFVCEEVAKFIQCGYVTKVPTSSIITWVCVTTLILLIILFTFTRQLLRDHSRSARMAKQSSLAILALLN